MLSRFHGPRYTHWVVGALFIALGLGWLLARYASNGRATHPTDTRQASPALMKTKIYLYFGDPAGHFLRAEQQVVDRPVDDIVFGRQLIQALIEGPGNGGSRTLPPEARLRAFFISDGTAYVDFESNAFAGHPGGIETELLTLYAIVNTLVVNVEAIREVKILIGGQPSSTLAGHVDLLPSFTANMMWIR